MPGAGRGARERLLSAARELFGGQGINATGIAELCSVAQVSRRTLYQHFDGKDELVVAWLTDAAADDTRGPGAVLSRIDLAPRARLLELFATIADGHARSGAGDPFVRAAIELPDPAHPAHRLAVGHRSRFAERLSDLARAAGARDPETVGRRLALLYDGAATAVAVAGAEGGAVDDAHAMAAELLRRAID